MENTIGAVEETAATKLQPEDFTHDEKLRMAALGFACRYYLESIVKDGELYREMVRNDVVLKPCSVEALLECAFGMEMFISGKLSQPVAQLTGEVERPVPSEKPEERSRKAKK